MSCKRPVTLGDALYENVLDYSEVVGAPTVARDKWKTYTLYLVIDFPCKTSLLCIMFRPSSLTPKMILTTKMYARKKRCS